MKIAHEVYMSAICGKFDKWREHYPSLGIDDLIWLNTAIDHFYPHQVRFNFHEINHIYREIKSLVKDIRIVEVGCHRGSLAAQLLAVHPEIKTYVGFDINYHALGQSVVKDKRFYCIKLTRWIYETAFLPADIFISSHTFEHFNKRQVELTLKWCHMSGIEFVIIEMPFDAEGWAGYRGSHVFVGDKNDFLEAAQDSGYSMFLDRTATIFSLRRNGSWQKKKQDTTI